VLSSQARPDVPKPPATPVAVQQVLRPTTPAVTENQKAFVVAAKQMATYDRARAIRQFPELVHLQS
jgi:hypothetical protein